MKTAFHFLGLSLVLCLSFIPSTAQQFAIEAQKQNVLHIGRDNPMSIIVAGYSCKDIVIKVDNGRIEKTGDCGYNIVPLEIGEASIQIFSRNGNRLLGARKFRVKQISPLPVVKVAGKRYGTVLASVLRAQLGLAVVVENLDWDPQIKIIGFSMTLIRNNESCQSFPRARDAYFTEIMKAALANVRNGDRIVFTGIEAIGPSDIGLQLDPMELTVE